ncbi:transglutaminase family protein [Rufibacter glacialis]|uniref:Transglutaminase family protein n=1 Tax=Rufibacter glacialis TaxID=1259555 RepID=A0A5M8QHV8_9BACT|nr:transglutaminase family protein [Rufibacter glacialis]KAA6434818.1 transglutaminase family protein [Rufibacter glacialis]GGK72689.1 hypothetical protein GCM10011405_21160 [Rufibacter glacialis]
MKAEITTHLTYAVDSPSTILLSVQPFPTQRQKVIQEHFTLPPDTEREELRAVAGEKRISRLQVVTPGTVTFSYNVLVENHLTVLPAEQLNHVPIAEMPASVLPYLNPSRYCQSDRLYRLAASQFGHLEHAFEQVMAVRDWIHSHVEYSGGYTTPHTSALDTLTERVGVCRDFAHLGVTLCRALTIPARYCTGYAYRLQPADFHACFEVYLGGHWVLFDATKLVPLNGLVKIATGVDAAETAVASTFGQLQFQELAVDFHLLDPDFTPVDGSSPTHGYCLQ